MERNGRATSLAKLKEILAPMTRKERLEYLWEYYKAIPIGIVVFIAVFGSAFTNLFAPDVIFEGAVVNVELPENGATYITDQWLQELGGDAKKEIVKYTPVYFEDLLGENVTSDDIQQSQNAAMQVTLMVTSQSLDYILMDETAMRYYINQRALSPLDKTFSQEQLQQLEEQVIYAEEEDGTRYPVAVRLSETAFGEACSSIEDKVFIGFPANTERAALGDDFLMYLLDWKP